MPYFEKNEIQKRQNIANNKEYEKGCLRFVKMWVYDPKIKHHTIFWEIDHKIKVSKILNRKICGRTLYGQFP